MAPLKVGILLLGDSVQLLDCSPADLLGMTEPYYLKAAQVPDAIVGMGVETEWHYISEAGPDKLMQMTAGAKYGVTDTLESTPQLDLLLVGGPEPSYQPSAAVLSFLQKQLPQLRAYFSVCTGILPSAQAGLLKGKRATAPRALLPMLRGAFTDVHWEDKRWVKDGNIWTSGGITNGLDMVAAYLKETLPGPVAGIVLDMADVGDRGQEYPGPMKGPPMTSPQQSAGQ
ncbi:MAG: hypothetical protein M1832_000115 [Thelocarpon impressellum]|nr:MAG: hypothetical protein M1832_000115 [Thelocarpon impressellum]